MPFLFYMFLLLSLNIIRNRSLQEFSLKIKKSRMSPQLEPVAELKIIKTHADNPGSPGFSKFDQLLQANDASKRSPSAASSNEDDLQGDHPNHKKSLFSKMKEKAKKLQHSLSHKKRHDEDGDTTPSRGVKLEDHETKKEEQEVPECLGAPIYESKKAPEELKETARQRPRANPVIPENHVLSVPSKHGAELEQQNPAGSDKKMTGSAPETLAPSEAKEEEPLSSPSKTVTETVAEKLSPAYAKFSDVTQAITSKIQALGVSALTVQETERGDVSGISNRATAGTDNPVGSESQVLDKGVSVKEYIMQKFEPGEDDKALSQVISEAMSPRRASADAGTNWRAKERESAPSSAQRAPISSNTHEITEEENHGKILQPN